jgi:hypothetical protein
MKIRTANSYNIALAVFSMLLALWAIYPVVTHQVGAQIYQSADPPKPPSPSRISDSYAKAALKALDTIYITRRGFPEALINADAEAVGAEETALTRKLTSIYLQEQLNERVRHSPSDGASLAAEDSCDDKRETDRKSYTAAAIKNGTGIALNNKVANLRFERCVARAAEQYRVRHRARVLEMDLREAACYKLFANALRNRLALAPKECDSLATVLEKP